MAAPWARGYRVVVKGRIHGQRTINVLHFATNTVINDADQPALNAFLLALLTAAMQCWVQVLLPVLTTDWVLESMEGTQVYPALGDSVILDAEAGSQGENGPASVSFETSVISILTGKGGRSKRGRFALPPVGEANSANSILSDPAKGALLDFIACIAGKFIGVGGTEPTRLGVLSRKTLAGNAANFDNAFTEATSLTLSPVIGVMTSRKVGRGD